MFILMATSSLNTGAEHISLMPCTCMIQNIIYNKLCFVTESAAVNETCNGEVSH
jgi:hypothetical protein